MPQDASEMRRWIDDHLAELYRTREQTLTFLRDIDLRIKELEEKRQALEFSLATPSAQLQNSIGSREMQSVGSRAIGTNPRGTVRQAVLEALSDFQCCAYSRQIALLCEAKDGKAITPERFGSLDKDERNAFVAQSRPRAVWLCHPLTNDGFDVIKRLWARSDWPLSQRIVGPDTSRVQYLKTTAKLCEMAMAPKDFEKPEIVVNMAAAQARELPGMDGFKRNVYDFERWRDLALKCLTELEPQDERTRRAAASRLEALPDHVQLFGMPAQVEGDSATGTVVRAVGSKPPLRIAEE